jgi:hypothetical protein
VVGGWLFDCFRRQQYQRRSFASQLGSISGNNNRGRSRYAERAKR